MRKSTISLPLHNNSSISSPALSDILLPPLRKIHDPTVPQETDILFKTFIKKLPAALAIFDTQLRFIIASDAYIHNTHLSTSTIIGKKLYDIVPDIPKKWRDHHQRALKGEHLFCEADKFKRADNTIEWWRWELLPWYQSNDELGGIILFVEEITRRKALERKMKEMIKSLNRSNEDLERFAHVCAHDLKEPLRTIGSYCHLLQKNFTHAVPPEAKKLFASITENVQQMGDLINGILGYSQLEPGNIHRVTCSTQHIVTSVKVILEEGLKQKSAVLKYTSLPNIFADKILISRVFQNLISNALKFNENSTPIIEITAEEKKKNWVFSIKDNGIGIKAKHYKSIFDPFKRLYPQSQYKGTGLGLSLCKKIIEAHGGNINVESRLNQGTCFSFSLPKKRGLRLELEKAK